MSESKVHFFSNEPLVALLGNPNCGKTALFNLLTGSRQKVANYSGVTVERKEGRLALDSGKNIRILDLPGAYSLYPRSLDERVTCNVLLGRAEGEKRPDLVLCILSAMNLRRNLRLVLAAKRLGLPCIVVLNMLDIAKRQGLQIDTEALSNELGLPVLTSIGIQSNGADEIKAHLSQLDWRNLNSLRTGTSDATLENVASHIAHSESDNVQVQRILQNLHLDEIIPDHFTDRLDSVLLHPVFGPIILVALLFCIFQAVFSWATFPMELIKTSVEYLGTQIGEVLPNIWLRSLLINGILAGLGGVVIFLPQILILFFFILLLEESGYLPRAAYLLDRVMGSVGLSGRSFIPLLSSFACAIPGIMATRSISNARDRLVTILIAPMMTCSARLPVYALLISAFIPEQKLWLGIDLQGLVLFLLYLAGILGAMAVAWILKRFTSEQFRMNALMMELPSYHLPRLGNLAISLWQRAEIFLRRVGGIILIMTVGLWILSSFPLPPEGATLSPIQYSFAGMLGQGLVHIFSPIGFNWQISIALVPGMAAREVVVSSLATVYALSSSTADAADALIPLISSGWSLATALSLLAWFVFAPQCLSTIAAVKRETGGWKIPVIMLSYLFGLAYLASFITYRSAIFFGLG
ncbi:ferrous iron transporter B [Polynucleobacter asymbioticus]|uniref:Ferrous iron transport protein B n=1 Tax=Polynucleobacter asymbioticus TaxID=576611 RepID=A0AAC9ITF9_9BURK|nr:ferrous iron transporter B [Polynucleobacter asymbioticus]APB99220.1 ferrous iron transporter B [Polynucleobacter asymbioticus]APC01520.1 ferrous iron transporter B [Polynucleobacter asymbioticus]